MISVELSKRFKKIVREAGREKEVSVTLKLVFEANKGILSFDFAGDHDEVQNYLRGKR
jgi:hypothetical protein